MDLNDVNCPRCSNHWKLEYPRAAGSAWCSGCDIHYDYKFIVWMNFNINESNIIQISYDLNKESYMVWHRQDTNTPSIENKCAIKEFDFDQVFDKANKYLNF
jgi:hypothetical protein